MKVYTKVTPALAKRRARGWWHLLVNSIKEAKQESFIRDEIRYLVSIKGWEMLGAIVDDLNQDELFISHISTDGLVALIQETRSARDYISYDSMRDSIYYELTRYRDEHGIVSKFMEGEL